MTEAATEILLSSILVPLMVWCFAVAFRLYQPQLPACHCLNAVPVHIASGEQVSRWCPDCGKTVYMARWVFRGE